MNTGKKYQTRQKAVILRCLQEHENMYLTISQLVQVLKEKNQKVGLTTIYRNLEILEREHKLSKVGNAGGKGACYKYLSAAESGLFHLKCEGCGILVNVYCPELKHLYTHVAEEHHVTIDPIKTVFYGKCGSCLH